LEEKGLLNIIPRKGTFVRKITKKDVEENFTILACLEGLAARQAIFHLTSKKIKEMESAFSNMAEAAKRRDINTYLKYHTAYHEIFTKASKNDALIEILENMRRLTTWYRFSNLRAQAQFEYTIPVHRKILDLFIKKDPNGVEALVKEHLLVALDNSLKFLASKTKTAKSVPLRVRRRSMVRVKH
jgi:DNA-binding GntR family transcriptional regulator